MIFFRESNTDYLKDNVQHEKIPSDMIDSPSELWKEADVGTGSSASSVYKCSLPECLSMSADIGSELDRGPNQTRKSPDRASHQTLCNYKAELTDLGDT